MAESTELLIIVRAKDLASKVFSTVLGTAKLFGKSLTGIFSGLGNIFFSLKTALIGFLSAAAFKRVVDEVSDLVDASDRLGLSFRTLQGLSLAAALGGSSRQELLVGVKNLARLLEEARNGGEQARETFARLGIDWNAAAGEAGELNTYLEAVATPIPNADVCAPTPIGDDPGDRPAWPGADESDTQPRSMSEIRGVNDVDDGDHVPASSIPIHGEERREDPYQ